MAAGTLTVLTACGTSVQNLEVGQCISEAVAGEEVSTLPVVECSEPHVGEIYALHQLPDGDFPGDQAVGDQGDQLCAGQTFQDYVGVAYDQSEIYFTALVPTEGAWDGGDHEIACILTSEDSSPLSGTLRNASR